MAGITRSEVIDALMTYGAAGMLAEYRGAIGGGFWACSARTTIAADDPQWREKLQAFMSTPVDSMHRYLVERPASCVTAAVRFVAGFQWQISLAVGVASEDIADGVCLAPPSEDGAWRCVVDLDRRWLPHATRAALSDTSGRWSRLPDEDVVPLVARAYIGLDGVYGQTVMVATNGSRALTYEYGRCVVDCAWPRPRDTADTTCQEM